MDDDAGIAYSFHRGTVRAGTGTPAFARYPGGVWRPGAVLDGSRDRARTSRVTKRAMRTATRRSRGSSGVGESREFLERIARILVHSGHSPRNLQREFAQVCGLLKEPRERWDAARLNYVSDLPHVIAQWHADTQYLDSHGAPLALPFDARGPSLTSLIRRVLPHANPSDVVASLRELKGIRRHGQLYRPTGQYLAFNQHRTSALAHGLTALLGMLRTVEHNVSSRRGATLLERAAVNPAFPVGELASFHRRLRSVASDFLWAVDGDMRRREGKRRGGRTTRLGVGVFAFEDPQFMGTARRLRVPRRKARRARAS